MTNNMSADRSREDYLEAILSLIIRNGACRATDIADELGFSRASVSVALRKLEESGLVIRDEWRVLLTEAGAAIASETRSKHRFFTDLFTFCDVEPETAEKEACLVEHAVSDESFHLLLTKLQPLMDAAMEERC